MTESADLLEPRLGICLPVPPAGPGVCLICHGGPGPRQELCASCVVTMDQVSRPTTTVVPISLYQVPGELWRVLRVYKDGPRPDRARCALQVAVLLARFSARHRRCLARSLGGAPDVVATVPSTRGRAPGGRSPMDAAVAAVAGLARLHAPLLAPGSAPAGHSQADDDAFAVTRRLRGERVLLVDDTFTTGARAQSAASALFLNGAGSVTVLTVGRVIWPGWNENCRLIWERAQRQPFSFTACCLCPGV